MIKTTLAVLAAGMGSRYGGLKQIEGIDKMGHMLIDYSVYDAICAGFNRVVFIIRREMQSDFVPLIEKRRWTQDVEVNFAFQKNLCRSKPWGTGHAIACLDGIVDSPFAVINSDDFYGRDSFLKIYSFLKNSKDDNSCAMVGYKLKNTLSKNGVVSRGVCMTEGEYLKEITETSGISENDGIITSLNGDILSPEALVSMNIWGFTPEIIKECKKRFEAFLNEKGLNDEISELYLSSVVAELIKEGRANVQIFETNEKWYGMTYKNDKSEVSLALERMVDKGMYPINL